MLLLVGVPVALVLGVGNPLPTEAPSAEWLTADVGPALVIDVLAVLVWILVENRRFRGPPMGEEIMRRQALIAQAERAVGETA